MPNRLLAASALALCALSAAPAHALDHAAYLANRDRSEIQAYVQGVGEGFGWAVAFTDDKQPRLYCAPDDKAHTRAEYLAILDEFVAANGSLTEYPVEMILLLALQARYPC